MTKSNNIYVYSHIVCILTPVDTDIMSSPEFSTSQQGVALSFVNVPQLQEIPVQARSGLTPPAVLVVDSQRLLATRNLFTPPESELQDWSTSWSDCCADQHVCKSVC